MADNTTLNTGTGGDVIATDDIAGVKYQRVKIVLGADGVNGGDVSSTNALPISDNSGSITVDNAGTFAVQAAQSGNYTVRNQDGVGNNLASSTTTPVGTEQALIVRNIPSGTQTISGTITANAGTGSFTVAQATAANLNATVTGTVASTQSGTWNVGLNAGSNAIGSITNTSFAATQGTASSLLNKPYGAVTTAAPTYTTGTDNALSLTTAGALRIDGSASTQPVSGTITANAGTGSFTVAQATAANLNATVTGTVAATQSGTWNVTNISGTVSLPTGAATSANQTTEITSLQLLDDVVATDGTAALTKLYQVGGTDGTNAQILSTNTSGHLNIADGANSITVDAPDATPIPVKLGDGTNYLVVDTLHNDGESTTENHLDVAAKIMNFNGISWDRVRGDTTGLNQQGNIAHNTADAGNPVKIGAKAIAHGTNPTAVAAANRTDLYANRAGVLFTIGGHPNIITRTAYISAASGAQTDATLVGTIAIGTKVAVTSIAVTVDSATTASGGVAVKVGFGATTIPADSATGANGILLDHKGIAAGSGIVMGSGAGLLGIGADGEELRLTCEVPTGGGLSVTFSYYTIES